jgi:hypothetical protein
MAHDSGDRSSNGDRLDAYAERIVRAAPPFSARQRARIAAILNDDDAARDPGSKIENRTPDRCPDATPQRTAS